ncbi:MAG: Beta-barrel assembly-enhancing protease [Steroidobacteraceae bacterium]|nr:Beta-barrel assembly-enhancing protease [Steroidobacteraceae bacterium]
MDSGADSVGTLDVALAHASRLLQSDPRLAAQQADEILNVAPGHPVAQLTLGSAYRRQGEAARALDVLEPLARAQPNWGVAQLELGLALANAHRGDEAIVALRRAVELKPDLPDAWRILGDHLTLLGETEAADAAYARHIRHSTRDPRLLEPAAALCEGRIPEAEHQLRNHLKEHPTDVAAIRMLAEVAARIGRYGDAEKLLSRCLELAPGFLAARHNLAVVLQKQAKLAPAIAEIELLLTADPGNPGYRNLAAALAARLGDMPRAIGIYTDVLREYPRQPKLWMSFGHTLKTAGRLDEAIGAYRRCLELAPHFGEAWWSLANLKTFRFSAADIAAMRRQLERRDLADEDRFHFDFALGKALEDSGDYAASFRHYEAGNRLRRKSIFWSAADYTTHVARSRTDLTAGFFAARAGWGAPAADPIFIVGLPRAGSTLIEQILSSHSQVEGTMELPDIIQLARELGGATARGPETRYFEALARLGPEDCARFGERYLAQTRIQRRSAAPYFIDKMPNNFAHVGLIHLVLPNAKIIDARRHPLGCCFSAYKQHFARGQAFSYSLEDLGRYYRDYVDLMAHYDAALPGRVHRVFYERMVDDTEGEVRRLLEYCGLPFESACLQFYANDRAVRTASSEQVRRPIYRDGVDHWRHYEPWLDPLKEVLGPIAGRYPEPPTV